MLMAMALDVKFYSVLETFELEGGVRGDATQKNIGGLLALQFDSVS